VADTRKIGRDPREARRQNRAERLPHHSCLSVAVEETPRRPTAADGHAHGATIDRHRLHFEPGAEIRGTDLWYPERHGEPQQRKQRKWAKVRKSAIHVRSFSVGTMLTGNGPLTTDVLDSNHRLRRARRRVQLRGGARRLPARRRTPVR